MRHPCGKERLRLSDLRAQRLEHLHHPIVVCILHALREHRHPRLQGEARTCLLVQLRLQPRQPRLHPCTPLKRTQSCALCFPKPRESAPERPSMGPSHKLPDQPQLSIVIDNGPRPPLVWDQRRTRHSATPALLQLLPAGTKLHCVDYTCTSNFSTSTVGSRSANPVEGCLQCHEQNSQIVTS